MKRTGMFAAAIAMLLAVACTKDETPTVSFTNASPAFGDGVATLKIFATDYDAAKSGSVTVPVTFGGTAVKGEDYTVSAEAFVLSADSPVTEITVTSLNYGGDEKTLTATLGIPSGFEQGQIPTAQLTLGNLGFLGYASFQKKSDVMSESLELTVQMFDDKGNKKTMERDAVIPVKVDTEKSTAVEGTNFSFDGEKSVTIAAGSNSGTIKIKTLNREEGKDKIVLMLDPSSKFSIGQYQKTTVAMLDSYYASLNGVWKMNEVVTTAESLDEEWGGSCTYNGLPEFNEADSLTIDLAEGTLTPAFKSTYKNYFIGVSKIVKGRSDYPLHDGSSTTTAIQLVELDNVNRFFSATEMSEDKVALVGFLPYSEDGKEYLTMYIIDHTSKSFMPELLDYDMYDTVKPVAWMSSCFLKAIFVKAEDEAESNN